MAKANDVKGEGPAKEYHEPTMPMAEWIGKPTGKHSWSDHLKGNFFVRGNAYRFTLMVRGYIVLAYFVTNFVQVFPYVELSKETLDVVKNLNFGLDIFIWFEYACGSVCLSVVQTFLKLTGLVKFADSVLLKFYLHTNQKCPVNLGDTPFYAFDLKSQNYFFLCFKIFATLAKELLPWYLGVPISQGLLWFVVTHHTLQIPFVCMA